MSHRDLPSSSSGTLRLQEHSTTTGILCWVNPCNLSTFKVIITLQAELFLLSLMANIPGNCISNTILCRYFPLWPCNIQSGFGLRKTITYSWWERRTCKDKKKQKDWSWILTGWKEISLAKLGFYFPSSLRSAYIWG